MALMHPDGRVFSGFACSRSLGAGELPKSDGSFPDTSHSREMIAYGKEVTGDKVGR
jgi:hypothetical protein